MRPLQILFLLLLLAPSAVFLWTFSDVPRFGNLHDDSLYYVSAKSLAGGEYRIESLPGEPAQTKYPPLYPLLLSAAWRLNPSFPGNLSIAAWLSWLALPLVLYQLVRILPQWGFTGARMWAALALFMLNPYIILFSTQLLSEMLFLALVLAAMRLIERRQPRWAAAAGAVAGLAYLTRSAGLALLAAGIIYYWIRKERRLAMIFAGAMLPFVAGWMAWARLHQTPTTDPALLYYVDYFRYQLYSVSLSNLHLFLWKNADGLLSGLGGLILPQVAGSLLMKIAAQVIAVAMISGIVRMVRGGAALLYTLFAVFSALLLLVWHFPPNERFVLPLFPLALCGLIVEIEHLWRMLRAGVADRKQRAAAAGIMAFAGLLTLGALALQAYVAAVFLPEDTRQHRARRADRIAAYEWTRANTPPEATVYSADDALFYLFSGRHAMSRPLPPALWYGEDRDGIVAWMTNVRPFAQEHRLGFFEYAGVDIRQGVREEDRKKIDQAIRQDTSMNPVFQRGPVTLYGLRDGLLWGKFQ